VSGLDPRKCWWARQDSNLGPTDYEPINSNPYLYPLIASSASVALFGKLPLLPAPSNSAISVRFQTQVRHMKALSTVFPFPETVLHFCVSLQGFTPPSRPLDAVPARESESSKRKGIMSEA